MDNEFFTYEVHPVSRTVHENGQETMNQVAEDADNIYCWSVYGKLKTGELQCLADCPSKEIAESIAKALEGKIYIFISYTNENVSVEAFENEADVNQAFIDAVNESYAGRKHKEATTMEEAQELYEEAFDRGGMDYYRIDVVDVKRQKIMDVVKQCATTM